MFNLEEFLNAHNLISCNLPYESKDFFVHATEGIDSSYVRVYKMPERCFGVRQMDMKLGRYLRAVYTTLTPGEITHICERYKAILETTGTFKIIEGDELKETYYRTHYVPNHGTLSNSCMRFLRCQRKDYFKIYGDNAKMLIMTPKNGKRILGRAILWEYNGTYLMDRVYTAESYMEHQFYNYAKEKGYGVLYKNSWTQAGEVQRWLLPDDMYKMPRTLMIQIKIKEPCKNYPYMDSFCYINDDETILSTYPNDENRKILHCTNGFMYEY